MRLQEAIVIAVLALVAVSARYTRAPDKYREHERLGVAGWVPASLGEWRNVTPQSVDPGRASGYNELYQALYEHPRYGRITVTIEYTTDSRRQFELHYPDVCHEIRGDRVIPYPAWNLALQGGTQVEAAVMSWQQPNGGFEALAVYWYVTRNGVTTDTLRLKWDQALAGLLRRPGEAVMVRFDSFHASEPSARVRAVRMEAVRDLASHLSAQLEPAFSRRLFKQLDGAST